MGGPQRRVRLLGTVFALALAALGLDVAGAMAAADARPRVAALKRRPPREAQPAPTAPSAPQTAPGAAATEDESRAFLIYLVDGGEPIVVTRYAHQDGMIVFEKGGGVVQIPGYEVLKIVPDEPDRLANLPPPAPMTGGAPLRPEPDLFVTMRGGGNLKVTGLTAEGSWVRVSMPQGSFAVPRSEILGVVRVPPDSDVPEAWLSIRSGDRRTDRDSESSGGGTESAGLIPTTTDPRLPYQQSDEPHLLRLANGQLMRIEAFWVEDGEFRFRRFGGIVGVALPEIMRVIPEDIPALRGRTPVRFSGRLAPDLLEVRVRSGYHRVRLVGVEPVAGTWTGQDPWRKLDRGTIVHLEFDRQRYDAEGSWLAYVFLPNGRMLNAELIRLGLARPRSDGRNVRYLDLFHELAGTGLTAASLPETAVTD